MVLRRVVPALVFALSFSALHSQDLAKHAPDVAAKQPPPAALVAPASLTGARQPNANAIYQTLRNRAPAGAFQVKNVTIKRDAGELRFADGTITLYSEVNGMVTGAIFQGQGTLHIDPPSEMEKHQLKLVMKTEVLDQPFTTAVMAFTDDTAKELKAASAGEASAGSATGAWDEMKTLYRKELHYDLEERLLADVLTGKPGGFFMANVKGPMFSKRLLYFVDPIGAFGVSPEAVGLLTSADGGYDVALGFPSAAQRKGPFVSTAPFSISQQTIDATIERNGKLTATATALVKAERDGVRVLPLELYPTLRASGVWNAKGEALDYIQEDKDQDPDFAVVLDKPLAKGETIQITTSYSGKEVIAEIGGLNYEVNAGARESWYPNVRGSFGNYSYYNLTFRTPKEVQVVGTGDRVSEDNSGKMRVSVWQTPQPFPVAGFNLGQFKADAPAAVGSLTIQSYANTNPSDWVSQVAGSGEILGGTMDTTGMLKRATSEARAAVAIYTDYFGPLQYDRLAITQQSYLGFGQSWPMMVYLPISYFWDSTILHQLGMLESDPIYWKAVTAHEVAHQWWGQTVGFDSYRDQWMSEGFADFSASLFLMRTNKDMKPYYEFWAEEKRRLLEKNTNGVRPVDVGPVVMGARVSSSRAGGGVYQSLIYPKGAYILHMLQMAFWTTKYGDAPFKKAMQDFVVTYRNKAATTEDFKAVMEKNMPPWMDIDKNHKLDWFFDAYVYGTEVPNYAVTSSFEKQGDNTVAHFKVTQSGVSSNFRMMVPLYIEWDDKSTTLLGHATMVGNTDVEQAVPLGKLQKTPKRFVVNANYDLLATGGN